VQRSASSFRFGRRPLAFRRVVSFVAVGALAVGCGGGGAVPTLPTTVAFTTTASPSAIESSRSSASPSPRPSPPSTPLQTGLPPAYGVAGNGSFVYDLDGDIYLADPTGEHAAAITSGPEIDVSPAFSHDGTRITFLRVADAKTRLMVTRPDGTGTLPLTGAIHEVDWYDWSPDDSRLAIYHQIGGAPSISIVAADGSQRIKTMDLGGIEPGDRVDWRPPDGRELMFTGHTAKSPNMGLYAIAPDGTGLRTVGAVSKSEAWFNDFQLSPDGSTVLYWSWGPNASGVVDGWSHLRDTVTGKDRLVELYSAPRLSPDGRSILGETSAQLVIGPADGTAPTRNIGPSYAGQAQHGYDFSPDGKKVILTVGDPGVTWIIDIASGEEVATAIPVFPSWQRLTP
jgi:Tol biopolymer transport system component